MTSRPTSTRSYHRILDSQFRSKLISTLGLSRGVIPLHQILPSKKSIQCSNRERRPERHRKTTNPGDSESDPCCSSLKCLVSISDVLPLERQCSLLVHKPIFNGSISPWLPLAIVPIGHLEFEADYHPKIRKHDCEKRTRSSHPLPARGSGDESSGDPGFHY